jgi:hypothetical protein
MADRAAQTNLPNNNRRVQYERPDGDWFCEPAWAADLIFASGMIPDTAMIWDPACGRGNIVQAAKRAGHRLAIGTDLVQRGGALCEFDFFRDRPERFQQPGHRVAIVSNPPFNLALEWAIRALALNLGPVALIVQLRFLAGLTRAHLYAEYPPAFEAVFADRPSMPPGEQIEALGDAAFSGGTIDFACIVWNTDRTGPTVVRKLYREANFAGVAGKYRAAKGRVEAWARMGLTPNTETTA